MSGKKMTVGSGFLTGLSTGFAFVYPYVFRAATAPVLATLLPWATFSRLQGKLDARLLKIVTIVI
jgi:hypothetical protein